MRYKGLGETAPLGGRASPSTRQRPAATGRPPSFTCVWSNLVALDRIIIYSRGGMILNRQRDMHAMNLLN